MAEKQSQTQGDLSTVLGVIAVIMVLLVILLPAVPFFLAFIAIWKGLRLKWWYLVAPAAVIVLLLMATNTAGPLVSNYLDALKVVIVACRHNRFTLNGVAWGHVLPVAALLGLVGAAGVAGITETRDFKMTHGKKSLEQISSNVRVNPLAAGGRNEHCGK